MRIALVCSFLMSISVYASYQPPTEFNYHFEGDIMWMRRARLNSIGLIDYDGDFCTDGVNTVGTGTLVHGLDKAFAARLSFLMQPNQNVTMEGRAILPVEFVSDIYRASEGETNVNCTLAEGSYLNVDDDSPLPTSVINSDDSDYVEADKAHAHYQTSFWDIEANYWVHLSPERVNYFSVGWACGLRYLSLQEVFRETFYKDLDASFFRVQTGNDMWGGQAIGKFEVNPYSFLTWGLRFGAGVFANHIKLINHVTDHNAQTNLILRSEHELYQAYLGEGEVYIKGYFLSRLNWYIGFDGLWLRGAALAPNNINLTEKITPINKNENIFINSWIVGLAFSF